MLPRYARVAWHSHGLSYHPSLLLYPLRLISLQEVGHAIYTRGKASLRDIVQVVCNPVTGGPPITAQEVSGCTAPSPSSLYFSCEPPLPLLPPTGQVSINCDDRPQCAQCVQHSLEEGRRRGKPSLCVLSSQQQESRRCTVRGKPSVAGQCHCCVPL